MPNQLGVAPSSIRISPTEFTIASGRISPQTRASGSDHEHYGGTYGIALAPTSPALAPRVSPSHPRASPRTTSVALAPASIPLAPRVSPSHQRASPSHPRAS